MENLDQVQQTMTEPSTEQNNVQPSVPEIVAKYNGQEYRYKADAPEVPTLVQKGMDHDYLTKTYEPLKDIVKQYGSEGVQAIRQVWDQYVASVQQQPEEPDVDPRLLQLQQELAQTKQMTMQAVGVLYERDWNSNFDAIKSEYPEAEAKKTELRNFMVGHNYGPKEMKSAWAAMDPDGFKKASINAYLTQTQEAKQKQPVPITSGSTGQAVQRLPRGAEAMAEYLSEKYGR